MAEVKTNKLNYIESKKVSLVWPIIFLVIVVVTTLWLHWYNYYLQKQVENLRTKSIELNNTAETLNNNPEIQAYLLLDGNKNIINELDKRSKITDYMKHLDSLQTKEKYDLVFEGFSINKWEITTTVTTSSSIDGNTQSGSLAYEKTARFIKEYRNDQDALLDLGFVNLIEWMDNMKYNVVFTIK